MEICFDTDLFGSGYAWIFPHKGYDAIGCGQEAGGAKRISLQKGFDKWLAQRKIEIGDAELQGWTISFDYRGFQFGNVFLAGDAGGFASGLTGEGMYFALISGRDVARKIIDPNYKCKGIAQILKIKRYHEKTLAISTFFIKLLRSRSNSFFKFLLSLAKYKWFTRWLIKYYG